VFDSILQDVRYALRTLRGAPGFALAAILTLALGIGANTAIFSVVDAVLLQPSPFAHPERIVRPFENVPAAESSNHRATRVGGMNALEFSEIQARTTTLGRVVTVGQTLVTLLGAGDAAFVNGGLLGPGTTAMFRVPPTLGRWFSADEERDGSHVVVLSHAAWRRYFAGDRGVLGRTVSFTGNSMFVGPIALGTAYTIIGVTPRGFYFPDDRIDFWTPAPPNGSRDSRERVIMIAELGDGVSPAAATGELASIVAAVRGTKTPTAPGRFELERVSGDVNAPIQSALLVLTGAVGFVLLIACVNVANLLLARTAAREREIAIRVAVGASRSRLVRQLLTESLLLALVGGAGGAALAYGGVAMFQTLATTLSRFDLGDTVVFPRLTDIAIDVNVLLFTVAISIATGLLFGLMPALRAVRVQQLSVPPRATLLHGLLAAEIALALPLVVGGGLLVRSFVRLLTIDRGYDAANVLTFQVATRGDRYTPDRVLTFADDLIGRLQRLGGVVAAGHSRQLPMVRLRDTHSFRRTPQPPPPGPAPDGADGRYASAQYVRARDGASRSGWRGRRRAAL